MEIEECGRDIIIKGVKDFHPVHIFECGQAFRWNPDGRGYSGIVKDRLIRLAFEGDCLTLENVSRMDYEGFWKEYFDLNRDYGAIKLQFSKDPILKEAISYGWGIRILNQDPWETLISFIISAHNGINRIKKTIENISRMFGKKVSVGEDSFYAFPSPESLAGASLQDIKECGCGYRAPYIKGTAEMVAGRVISLKGLIDMPYDKAHQSLLKCPGVGPKVADCVLLFSLRKGEAFPVDVWIKRVMEHFYFQREVSPSIIKEFAAEHFGPLAGLAQQYLFYYAREKKIGK